MGDSLVEIPISTIEHFSFCPRQCALIHVERVFLDNLYTVRGSLVHERVHSGDDEPTRGLPVRRGMALYSDRHGLIGKADLVELRSTGPYPVEYKSGRRHGLHADLQLCAQALCLEEMYDQAVPVGAIYYHSTRSRHEIAMDEALRRHTLEIIQDVRHMLRTQHVPPPHRDRRCRRCSLADACLPSTITEPARLRGLQGALYAIYDTLPDP